MPTTPRAGRAGHTKLQGAPRRDLQCEASDAARYRPCTSLSLTPQCPVLSAVSQCCRTTSWLYIYIVTLVSAHTTAPRDTNYVTTKCCTLTLTLVILCFYLTFIGEEGGRCPYQRSCALWRGASSTLQCATCVE